MESAITLNSLTYFTSAAQFLSWHPIEDQEAYLLHDANDDTTQHFAAVMAHNPGTNTMGGWGFFSSKQRGTRTFSLETGIEGSYSLLPMHFAYEGHHSTHHQKIAILTVIQQLSDPAIKRVLQDNLATCTETMWSGILGIHDQSAALSYLGTEPTPEVVQVGQDSTSPWYVTSDPFAAFNTLTRGKVTMFDLFEKPEIPMSSEASNGRRVIFEKGLGAEMVRRMGLTDVEDPGGILFALNPAKFPRHLLAVRGKFDRQLQCSDNCVVAIGRFPDAPNHTWLSGVFTNPSSSVGSDVQKASNWLQRWARHAPSKSLPQVLEYLFQVSSRLQTPNLNFANGISRAQEDLFEAFGKVTDAAEKRSTVYRTLTGAIPPTNETARWREAVRRQPGQVPWTPGTRFAGPSAFSGKTDWSLKADGNSFLSTILNPAGPSEGSPDRDAIEKEYLQHLTPIVLNDEVGQQDEMDID